MNECYIYGLHAVNALLANPHRKTKTLYVRTSRLDERMKSLIQTAEAHHIPIKRMSLDEMNKRFPDVNHQGVIAQARPLPEYGERDIEYLLKASRQPALILILDGVTDPHNLGACLRSADGAGVDFVIIPKDKSAKLTPTVSKVASGAAESMPLVRVTNLARAIMTLKEHGIWIYGAAGEATKSFYHLDLTVPSAFVMGSEGKGMRRLTRERCDHLFSLPMSGSVSSLNVSVSTGICLYEALRQRRRLS